MAFEDLRRLVEDISADERRVAVRFGCDCGCGGDAFTGEMWDEMCEASDTARQKLIEFGVTFSDYTGEE